MNINGADETAWKGTSSGEMVLGMSYNVEGNSISACVTIESTLDGRRRMLEGFKSECTTPHVSCRYSSAFSTCLTSHKINWRGRRESGSSLCRFGTLKLSTSVTKQVLLLLSFVGC